MAALLSQAVVNYILLLLLYSLLPFFSLLSLPAQGVQRFVKRLGDWLRKIMNFSWITTIIALWVNFGQDSPHISPLMVLLHDSHSITFFFS